MAYYRIEEEPVVSSVAVGSSSKEDCTTCISVGFEKPYVESKETEVLSPTDVLAAQANYIDTVFTLLGVTEDKVITVWTAFDVLEVHYRTNGVYQPEVTMAARIANVADALSDKLQVMTKAEREDFLANDMLVDYDHDAIKPLEIFCWIEYDEGEDEWSTGGETFDSLTEAYAYFTIHYSEITA